MKQPQRMNKKGWLTRHLVVAMVIFSGVIGLCFLMVASMGTTYDNPGIINEEFDTKYNNMENSTNTIGGMFNSSSGKEGLNMIGTFTVLFQSTFTVISLTFSSLSVVSDVVSNFANDFGIPVSVAKIAFTLILGILTATVVFIVVSALNRRDL